MPELPDVEHHRRTVAEHAVGGTVERVEVGDPALLHGTGPQGLGRSLAGRTLTGADRHGKWLLLHLGDEGPTLVVHFRMTGELTWQGAGEPPDPDAATAGIVLHLDRGQLGYRSRRRLGGITFVGVGGDPAQVTGSLGPDALGIDRATFAGRLADRRGGTKSALLDQGVIAGLGNELIDEILWRAGVHPSVRAAALDEETVATVHRELRTVLQRSVRAGHVPSGPTWLNGRRDQDGARCPRCSAALEVAQVAGRTTVWCPREQPAP